MAEFKDLPENASPVGTDLIAVAQDADDVTVKVQLDNLPIIGELASTSTGNGASKIGVEDAAGNFSATDLEGVLAELHAMLDGLDAWVSGTTYTAGEDAVILTTNNVIYRCTTTNSDVTFTPSNWQPVGKDVYTTADENISGSNVTLTTPTTQLIRLTNATLVSIDMIPSGETGNPIWLLNDTGVDVTITNETGATAANRIKTGTGVDLVIKDQASYQVIYDTTDSRWQVIGNNAATGGGGSSDYDRTIGTSGDADINTAVSGGSAGDSVRYLTESLPAVSATQNITKQLGIFGGGDGSIIDGDVNFKTGSDGSTLTGVKVLGTITIESGVKNIKLLNITIESSGTVHNNSGNKSNVFKNIIREE